MKHAAVRVILLILIQCLLIPLVQAADPPGLVNYQGVLRDASDSPLTGSFDMVFTFFGAETGGDGILIDEHEASGTGAVDVSGGMFGVHLGGGVVSDGPGFGFYSSLSELFRDYGAVWLEVTVNGETLSPRVRVAAAAYAMNSATLSGREAAEFLDKPAVGQTKTGQLTVNASGSGIAYLSEGDLGIHAEGNTAGGYFVDADGTGFSYAGYGPIGVHGEGNTAGGYFRDRNTGGWAYVGRSVLGLEAHGVGTGGYGVKAYGPAGGGYFEDEDSTGYAQLGVGDVGIEAYGSDHAAYFSHTDFAGQAWLGKLGIGIEALGTEYGGYFEDSNGSGYAYLAHDGKGIEAYGGVGGGTFSSVQSSAHLAHGDSGIDAYGEQCAGFFNNTTYVSSVWLAQHDRAIEARGKEMGGYFTDTDETGHAYVGYGNFGIRGYGDAGGGYFRDDTSMNYAYVAYASYKINGTGSVNFVQNHPEDPHRVIVYAAPEGDEVATYTRGRARLAGGEARVALGETFRWVTNPDIGLTAHLTPRGECNGLYVESLTTSEMVVRERGGGASDAAFDYIVFGLRIGFEETSVVQEKTEESYIPSMEDHRALYARDPDLRRFNALERYKSMEAKAAPAGVDAAFDLSASQRLRDAIQEFDRAIHGRPEPPDGKRERLEAAESSSAYSVERHPADTDDEFLAAGTPREPQDAPGPRPWLTVPVSEPVRTGDLLVLDPDHPGMFRTCGSTADRTVVGIAAEDSIEAEVPVALHGIVTLNADASYGAIYPGDLLTTSPTPGHAMAAIVPPRGTVAAKALEKLESGTGAISVLVMLR